MIEDISILLPKIILNLFVNFPERIHSNTMTTITAFAILTVIGIKNARRTKRN